MVNWSDLQDSCCFPRLSFSVLYWSTRGQHWTSHQIIDTLRHGITNYTRCQPLSHNGKWGVASRFTNAQNLRSSRTLTNVDAGDSHTDLSRQPPQSHNGRNGMSVLLREKPHWSRARNSNGLLNPLASERMPTYNNRTFIGEPPTPIRSQVSSILYIALWLDPSR